VIEVHLGIEGESIGKDVIMIEVRITPLHSL